MSYLLDVNVLIALSDANHEFHKTSWNWFSTRASKGWATCPITENGFVRIFGNLRYPNGPGSVSKAVEYLTILRNTKGHRFVPDDISISDQNIFLEWTWIGHKGLTDMYLLGLASKHSLKFVSFDSKIPWRTVSQGKKHLEILGL